MIAARKLTKRFRARRGEVTAVDGVDFDIGTGEFVGYVGPNGAGKSTTIKMMCGVLVPTSGDVRVDGLDPSTDRRRLTSRMGVVFGQRSSLWWDLPLRDSFDLVGRLYRMPRGELARRLDDLTGLLDLGPLLDVPVRALSLGQRMRGELAAALLHDPELVFLDEPTVGLDLLSKDAVRAFLADLRRERGVTVVLTTHDLVDVERLCDRLLIVDRGRVLEDTTVEGLKQRHGGERTLMVDLEEERAALAVPGAELVRVEGRRQWLRFDRDAPGAAAVIAAVVAQAPVRDLAIEEPTIEEVVRRIYRER